MFRALMLVLAVGAMYVAASEIEYYSDKYDDIDVPSILANDALREQYYDCFMDTKPCVTEDAVYFKENFPEAIVTKCQRCTEVQQKNMAILVEWYAANQEQKWNDLISKFLEDAKRMKIAGAA